jgi:hypothetical protein
MVLKEDADRILKTCFLIWEAGFCVFIKPNEGLKIILNREDLK